MKLDSYAQKSHLETTGKKAGKRATTFTIQDTAMGKAQEILNLQHCFPKD